MAARRRRGDPGRVHAEGLAARAARRGGARRRSPTLLGARSREVVFTSGATEAIAAACWGAAERGGHQVVPAVEHSAVRLSAERHGEVTLVGVDGAGRVDPDARARRRPPRHRARARAVGQPRGRHDPAGRRGRRRLPRAGRARPRRRRPGRRPPRRSTSATSAPTSCRSAPTSSAGRRAPAPSLVRRGLRLRPLLVGGDQERARRAGLENVPAIAGVRRRRRRARHRRPSRPRPPSSAASPTACSPASPTSTASSSTATASTGLPHIVCLGVVDVEPQAVLLGLDRRGVAAHSGSACSSEALEPSPVLEAMGVDAHRSRCACRSAGRPPTPTSTPCSRRRRRSSPSCGRSATSDRNSCTRAVAYALSRLSTGRAQHRTGRRPRLGLADSARPQAIPARRAASRTTHRWRRARRPTTPRRQRRRVRRLRDRSGRHRGARRHRPRRRTATRGRGSDVAPIDRRRPRRQAGRRRGRPRGRPPRHPHRRVVTARARRPPTPLT